MKYKIELNIIPMLHCKKNNVVIRPGQTAKADLTTLCFMTGLECDGKLYSNIENESPMSEMDMALQGRRNALLGYGCGINDMQYKTGEIKWRPTKMCQFFDVYKCADTPIVGIDPMPVLFTAGNDVTLYDVYADKPINLTPVSGIELLININAACEWANKNAKKYKAALTKVLSKCYIGWNTGSMNKTIVDIDDKLCAKKYMKFKTGWNYKDKLAILNSRKANII